jgi:hypothetical protein
MDSKLTSAFTMVFEGDIRKFKDNPFRTDTPWGRPIGVSMGDMMSENEKLMDEIISLNAR